MVVGGIVFRVVTPNYPGDPALDAAGAPSIRTEYLATDREPWSWTLEKGAAFFFAFHLDAENAAKAIGPHCHASVQAPLAQMRIPERLQPRCDDSSETSRPPLCRRKKKSVSGVDAFRVAQCRRDPVEVD